MNWVDIKPDIASEALEWAKKNCPNYITNEVITNKLSNISTPLHSKGWGRNTMVYRFYFSCEKEQTIFALRWS